MKKAVIISLHFSPAHASHMIAWGKLLRESGYAVTFLIDGKYCSVADFSVVGQVETHELVLDSYDLGVFCCTSTQNAAIAKRMRDQGATILYIFHEPESVQNMFSAGEGWKQTLRFYVSSHYSIKMLRLSSGVILPSRRAEEMYKRNFSGYNQHAFVLPLLFDDEIGVEHFQSACGNKQFFGFIGSASRGHGFDRFLAFVKYALRNGSTIPFLLATRTDLSQVLAGDMELVRYANEGKIQIHQGRPFPNDEINGYYLQSFCVWNLYRRSTQSGVLPRAFMAGASALAMRIGSFPDYIQAGVTGEFVDSVHDLVAILRVVEKIREQFPSYSYNCRKAFLKTFFYKANANRFLEILNDVCYKK